MTDNEIIKALECCSEANNCCMCEYEPTEYIKGTLGCANELLKCAFSLINRQKAENEKNENIIRFADKTIATQQAEIERLEKQLVFEIESAYDRGATAAIKEFAERVNKEAENVWIDSDCFLYSESDNTAFEMYYSVAEWCSKITGAFVKEMVGE